MNSLSADHGLWYGPEEISDFVDRLISEIQSFRGDERRGAPRRTVAVPIGVRPLGADLEPLSPWQEAITSDISTRGFAFWHHDPIRARFVEMSMASSQGAQVAAVAEVRHSTRSAGWIITGAEFLFTKTESGEST